MIENQLSDRLRAAVSDEPPLGFDPDDVVDRAVRNHRRRSAITGAATAAAVVVLATVTLLQVVRPTDQVGGVATQPSPTETKPACPTASARAETKPTESEPPVTKSIEPSGPPETKPTGPPETNPSETKPTEKPGEPGEPIPAPPCDIKTKDPGTEGWFDGSADAVKKLASTAGQVLTGHVPNTQFRDVGWKPEDDRRCVAGGYQLNGDGYSAISVVVCHDLKTGLDSTPVSGDWGSPVSDTPQPDGSHVVVYRFGDAEAGGLAVEHHRMDGVVVLIGTGFKAAHGQSAPAVSQEQMTAIATDGRLTF